MNKVAARRVREHEQADGRKDEFLAVLAHELRNPLAAIHNAVQLLGLADLTDANARSARDIIGRQVKQMARLVDDLLDMSRVNCGKIQLRKERIEVARLVTQAVEAGRPLIDRSRHDLAVSIPPEPIVVDADPVRLEQVFVNLLNNAAKYTPEGGRIWLTVERDNGEARVSLRDNGIGIMAEQLPCIFDIYAQGPRALERAQGGLGIGLALVRGLVELHGGHVEARSDGAGRGSEFIVHLAVADGTDSQLCRDGERGVRLTE